MQEVISFPKAVKYLLKLGIDNGRVIRGYRLAVRSQIVYFDKEKNVFHVLVPSQRLEKLKPAKLVTHMDILALAKGKYCQTLGSVGKLPIEQQYYVVKISRDDIRCECPDTIYNKNPLCVHKIAAIIRIYLSFGEKFVEENYGEILRKVIRQYIKYKRTRAS